MRQGRDIVLLSILFFFFVCGFSEWWDTLGVVMQGVSMAGASSKEIRLVKEEGMRGV